MSMGEKTTPGTHQRPDPPAKDRSDEEELYMVPVKYYQGS